MTPRRHRSSSNAVNEQNGRVSRTQSPSIPSPQSKRQLGMTPAIYENNMKVLHRREPSILSIFDQFSHVCVYHHNGSKWEKQGYEGSMFLFEKQTYPPYGFFILNRMGTDDYIRPIHPEDDMDVMGDYLMYRYYPKFTQTRIAMGLPYPIPATHRAALDAELTRQMTPEEVKASRMSSTKEWRGTSVTIGLWMFATDAREPLKDVMMRLHSYIKQGKPYPEEFRYGPGRPPPPNPHLRTASRASMSQNVDEEADMQTPNIGTYRSTSSSARRAPLSSATNGMAPSHTTSELDKLFAKLIPSVPSTPTPASEPQPAATSNPSSMSVHDLFAALGGTELAPHQAPAAPPASATMPNRGLALLDSIFASASVPASSSEPLLAGGAASQPVFPPQVPALAHTRSLASNPEDIQIVSPRPTSSSLPQILNQNVISSLLGLAPDSRSSSAAPSSVGSRRSGQHRYEGDNEYSEGDAASDYSASSTVLDAEADPAILAAGSSSGLPLFAVQYSASEQTSVQTQQTPRRVEGDVTPRATVRGIGPFSPPLQPQVISRTGTQPYLTPTTSSTRSSASTGNIANGTLDDSLTASASGAPAQPMTHPRTLVSFEADSELWPYPRAPLDDRSLEQDDADVVELDFADTRALSDPAMFSNRLKEKQSRANGKKKTRKERAAEREKERQEIEDGWDDPVRGQVQTVGPTNQTAVPPLVNGSGKAKQVVKGSTSGTTYTNGHTSDASAGLQPGAAREATISAVSSQPQKPSPAIPRNDFVRELLTLIHTDKGFVDQLWQGYIDRVR